MTSDVWGIFNLLTYLVHSTLIRYFAIYLQRPFLQMRFSLTYPITYLNIWCHIRIYECSLIYINRKLLITTTINFLGLGHLLCYHHNITYNSMGWKFQPSTSLSQPPQFYISVLLCYWLKHKPKIGILSLYDGAITRKHMS